MNSIIEQLKSYLDNTSEEQLLRDWAELDEFSNVGPDVDEYLEFIEKVNQIEPIRSKWKSHIEQSIQNESPGFPSGFFYLTPSYN
jgi:hypothetical protein